MTFTIEGQAVPQGRPRFTRYGHAYDPEKSRDYKEQVALAASLAMRGQDVFAKGTPLKCVITIWQKMPARFTKKQKELAEAEILRPTTKPDADNLAKAITDAMNGVVYADDAQIVELNCGKFYGAEPRVMVTVDLADENKDKAK